MSRPFSYNDENFTVIGNLLFIHFRDDAAHERLEPVLLIPPSIYERMVTNSFELFAQIVGENEGTTSVTGTTVTNNNEKFIAFKTNRPISVPPRYYIGFSQLKDI